MFRSRVITATVSLAILLLASSQNGYAQNITVAATVDESTIGSEDFVTYTISFSGKALPEIQTPQAPSSEGLALVRPFPTTSRNVSIIQGDMSQTVSFSWSYRALQEGTARIFPATVSVGGSDVRTNQIEITIVPQSQRPARPRQRNIFDPFGLEEEAEQSQQAISREDVFIRAVPSKRTVYVNEQLTIHYQLFFRTGIQLRQSRLADSWDAEGFWREELEVESRPIPTVVVENGIRYNKITLKKVAVFPTRSGSLTIDPLKIESEAALPGSGSFFSIRRSRYQPISVSSSTVRVTVKPLPDEAPASFVGGVGHLDFVTDLSATEVDLGKSTDLVLTLSGEGNISTLEPPVLGLPGAFEIYDPEVSTHVNRSGSFVTGSKQFRYVLVPRSNGTYTIPAIEFSYFDTSAGEYVSISSDEIPVAVTGLAAPAVAAIATASGLPVDDISGRQFLTADWTRAGRPVLHRSPVAMAIVLLPLVFAGIALAFVRRADALAADRGFARNKMAHPLAKRHLRKAAHLLKINDGRGYYAELERAVLSFVGNKLNIGEKAYTREELSARLRAADSHTDTISELNALLEECDRARFAPLPPSSETMQTAGDRAASIIVRLHNELQSQ